MPIYLYRDIGTRPFTYVCILHVWTSWTIHYLCVSVIYPCMDSIVYPQLTPSFHGSMARCLDLLRFALLHTTSFPSSFVPSSTEHRLFSTYDALAVTFVRSFFRSFVLLLVRAPCRFGDFNARQFLFSRLSSLSSLAPLRFPIPPHQITFCLLFRRARAFPFSSATYFPGQQVFFRRFSSRIYVCIYDVLAACAYNAMPLFSDIVRA